MPAELRQNPTINAANVSPLHASVYFMQVLFISVNLENMDINPSHIWIEWLLSQSFNVILLLTDKNYALSLLSISKPM
jgi:hypothetical protein